MNDFDEAWPASYEADLVRLVASCYLAIEEEHLSITRKKVCRAIEQGYRDSLARGGAPFVLADHHRWLRLLALNKLRNPVLFWKRSRNCPRFKGNLPKDVMKLLDTSMPLRLPEYEFKSRVAASAAWATREFLRFLNGMARTSSARRSN